MKILLVNDDGYDAKGIRVLARIMKPFGEVTAVCPKYHQSGMSMAVDLGMKPVAVKDLGLDEDGVHWYYVDGAPASCTKYAMDVIFADDKPDVVISGINHGLNNSTAMWYSGTIGAAREASIDGSLPMAVSLDNFSRNADFTVVEELFPALFEKLMANRPGHINTLYNINFPNLPASEIKGVRMCRQGNEIWVNEFMPWDEKFFEKHGMTRQMMGAAGLPEVEEGETVYMMAGDVQELPTNDETTDNWAIAHGYIAITPHSMDNTDYTELERLSKLL